MGNPSALVASYTASIPALRQYLQMAERAGVDVQSILTSAGLVQAVVNDNTQRIPLDLFEDIVRRLINASNDPLFGFHTSEFIEPAFYSVHGYISLNCSYLKDALATIPVYEKIVGDMGVSIIASEAGSTLLRWNSQLTDPQVERHVRENIICSWYRFTELFLKIEGIPEVVWFEHEPPETREEQAELEALFGCDVLFSQRCTGIWMADAVLNTPIEQADEKLLHVLFDHASQLLREIDQGRSLAEQIKGMLRLTLNHQIPSSELIADKLGISVRTLQRKLGDEGTSYKTVLNDLRKELALHYVKNTSLSLEEVAAKLGFSETRSFYRSFKQWTGTTASTYRQSR